MQVVLDGVQDHVSEGLRSCWNRIFILCHLKLKDTAVRRIMLLLLNHEVLQELVDK